MIEGVNLLLSTVVFIQGQAQLAKRNKKEAVKLAERLNDLQNLLPQSTDDKILTTDTRFMNAVKRCHEVATECQDLITSYQNKKWTPRFFWAGTDKENIAEMDKRITDVVTMLTAATSYYLAQEQQQHFEKQSKQLHSIESKIDAQANSEMIKYNSNGGIGHKDTVVSLKLLSDGTLASGAMDNEIRLWNTSKKTNATQPLTGHTFFVDALTECNNLLISGSRDKTIRVWDRGNHRVKVFRGHAGRVTALAAWTGKKYFASGSADQTIKIWDVNTGAVERSWHAHEDDVECLLPLKNGALASGANDGSLKIWNPDTGVLIRNLEGHSETINGLVQIADDYIASGSTDDTIKIWNTNTGRLVKTFQCSGGIFSLATRNNGRELIAGTCKGVIEIWNIATDTCTKRFQAHAKGVRAIEIFPNGDFATSSEDNNMYCWNATGVLIDTFGARTAAPTQSVSSRMNTLYQDIGAANSNSQGRSSLVVDENLFIKIPQASSKTVKVYN